MATSVEIHATKGSRRSSGGLAAVPAALSAMIVALAMVLFVAQPASAQGLFGGGRDSAAEDQRSAEMSVRINQLEGQMRGLNGQIEQLSFQVKQLQDLLQRMQKDTDFRLQELEGRGAAKPQKRSDGSDGLPAAMAPEAGMAAAVAPRPAAPASGVPAGMAPAISAAPINRGAPPANLGQTSGGADPIGGIIGSAPMDLSGTRSRDTMPVPGVDPRYAATPATPSARDEYDASYGYILSGEYELAERSFRSFLSNHPTDNRVGAAQFWLGESYFARSMYKDAADAFLKSYTQYPDGAKAPESLLKLGLSLSGLGEKKAACASWDELLAKYPKAGKAIRDRAAAEKSRGKC